MIRYEGDGDLFSWEVQTIAVPVNCVGVMGNGLARAFRDRVEGLYNFHRRVCRKGQLRPGHLMVYPIPNWGDSPTKQVLLFPTKDDWKRPSEVDYLELGFRDLAERYEELGITELAIPALGCGYGNLDYVKDFLPLVHSHFADHPLGIDIVLF